MKIEKKFYAKVYTNTGTFIKTFNDISFNGFRKQLNGGLGQLSFTLPRKFDDFDENISMKLNYRIYVWVVDSDTGSDGKLLFSGYIVNLLPVISSNVEHVEIVCFGFVTKASKFIVHSGTCIQMKTDVDDGLVSDDGTDASNAEGGLIAKAAIDLYQSLAVNPIINYSFSSVADTSKGLTGRFNSAYLKDIFDAVVEAAAGFYWYIGPDNIFKLFEKPASATHTFVLGKHFKEIKPEKNMEDVSNRILFSASNEDAQIVELYQDTDSSDEFDDIWETKTDNRYSDEGSIDNLGNNILAEKKSARVKTVVEILDNNGSEIDGYDIESIEPGDTCKIRGLNDTTSKTFNDNMLIVAVDYNPDSVILELETLQDSVSRATAENSKKIAQIEANNRPTEYGIVRAPQGPMMIPTGGIIEWTSDIIPPGFLLCNGQSLLRASYPLLFAVIGTKYGSADGTHFNVPDRRDNFAIGSSASRALASTGGSTQHYHTGDDHYHHYAVRTTDYSWTAAGDNAGNAGVYDYQAGTWVSASTGATITTAVNFNLSDTTSKSVTARWRQNEGKTDNPQSKGNTGTTTI